MSITERANTGEYQVHSTVEETGANEVKCQRPVPRGTSFLCQYKAGQGHKGLVFLELLLSQGCMNSSPGFGPGRCESGWPIMV